MIDTTSSQPLVSIGLPTYSRAPLLRRALEALRLQTYKNLEIIVSDNCSTDNTAEIVREAQEKDPRIIYLRHESNVGAFSNYKFVVEKASGDYFLFHADDHWLASNCVEALVNSLLQHDTHMIAVPSIIFIRDNSDSPRAIGDIDNPLVVDTFAYFSKDIPWKIRQRRLFEIPMPGQNFAIYGLIKDVAALRSFFPKSNLQNFLGFQIDIGGWFEVAMYPQLALLGEVYVVPDTFIVFSGHENRNEAADRPGLLFRGTSFFDRLIHQFIYTLFFYYLMFSFIWISSASLLTKLSLSINTSRDMLSYGFKRTMSFSKKIIFIQNG